MTTANNIQLPYLKNSGIDWKKLINSERMQPKIPALRPENPKSRYQANASGCNR